MNQAFDPKKVVVASKYFDPHDIRVLYRHGYRHFGESRVTSLLEKKPLVNLPIEWHFIGHLQSRQVKPVINEITTLHSLDSLKLANLINLYRHTPLDCFIQLNLLGDPNKHGIKESEIEDFIKNLKKCDKINIIGFMTIGVINDLDQTKELFKRVYQLKLKYQLKYTSMGMSEDYQLALAYPDNYLRIGRLLKGVTHVLF